MQKSICNYLPGCVAGNEFLNISLYMAYLYEGVWNYIFCYSIHVLIYINYNKILHIKNMQYF